METEYHTKTCIKWRPYKEGDENWVVFKSAKKGCSSYVGMQGGGQVINLHRAGCMHHHTATHEMMHAIGFQHQQSAADRDDYVDIHEENIIDGKEHNFLPYGEDQVTDFGIGYDYKSIMHYSKYAFSRNGEPTMTAKVNILIYYKSLR